jgi:hypothetical protein
MSYLPQIFANIFCPTTHMYFMKYNTIQPLRIEIKLKHTINHHHIVYIQFMLNSLTFFFLSLNHNNLNSLEHNLQYSQLNLMHF